MPAVSASAAAIRRGVPSDLAQLVVLLHRYYKEGEVEYGDNEAAVAACLTLPQLGFFVADLAAQLVACVCIRPLPPIPGAAECKRLFVAPEARGHGLAARLMDTAEDAVRGAALTWMYLDSKDNFPVAIAMYRRRGYHDCPRYNDNAEATIFLRKRLAD